MPTFSMVEDQENDPQDNGKARFTVFGVGGGGGNAVEHMVKSGISGVTFVCANTDRQALDNLSAPHLIQLGTESNRGLGAGADPAVGSAAAESDAEAIKHLLTGSDMVFITAGMGGGTGTGASPVIAKIAKEMGILTVAVVTTPFTFEGKKRLNIAKEGVEALVEHVDSIITIPNDKLLKVYGNISMVDAYKKADDILLHAVQGIADTIIKPGMINIDFNDIRTAMTARGHAMMGMGRANGDDRARQATEMAIRSPLLDDVVLENAKGLLVNITATADMTLLEYNAVTEVASQITDIDTANMFYGMVVDENMGDELRVTVIATGLSRDENRLEPKSLSTGHTQKPMDTEHVSALTRKQQAQETSNNSVPPATTATTVNKPRRPEKAGQSVSIQQYLRQQQKK